jgi:hypothetical protein
MGGTATLAGDLTLLLGGHGGEASAGLSDNFEHVGTLPFCANACSEMLATFGSGMKFVNALSSKTYEFRPEEAAVTAV